MNKQDIEVVPRTQQEIDDYGPNGIQLIGIDREPKYKPGSYPHIEPLSMDE